MMPLPRSGPEARAGAEEWISEETRLQLPFDLDEMRGETVISGKKTDRTTAKELANHEIVTLAVYLLGGRTKPIDTEDVAVKANELAPGRFVWKRYQDQINLEIVRVYLSDAKKEAKGLYVSGSGTDGWLLTERGLAFAEKHAKTLGLVDLSQEALDPREKRWRRAERARLLTSDAFRKFVAGEINAVTEAEAAAFFRVDAYVGPQMRQRRITRIINAFGSDPKLDKAISRLADIVRRAS